MTNILQHFASFAMMLALFYVIFRITRIFIYKLDKKRMNENFLNEEKARERDLLDEQRGREERRKARDRDL